MLGGLPVIKLFPSRRIYAAPEPLTSGKVWLSISCVFFNTPVAVAGWLMWRQGIIVIKPDIGLSCIVDVGALVLLMDFLMYVTHRIVHKTHHKFELTRPLSLFVISPLEVFGFGFLYSWS
ncbi:MAG: sterol desaturase family protein [Candidatus Obscuribacterales bacterium]|nr:sterol desaturase family protein [Candidatus Obscuribacterales bacterium]